MSTRYAVPGLNAVLCFSSGLRNALSQYASDHCCNSHARANVCVQSVAHAISLLAPNSQRKASRNDALRELKKTRRPLVQLPIAIATRSDQSRWRGEVYAPVSHY